MKSIRCGLLPGESRLVVERLNELLGVSLEAHLGIRVQLAIGKTTWRTAKRCGVVNWTYLGPVTYILQSRCAALDASFVRIIFPC
jgi:phosphonate transport system substrate-binding protein